MARPCKGSLRFAGRSAPALLRSPALRGPRSGTALRKLLQKECYANEEDIDPATVPVMEEPLPGV